MLTARCGAEADKHRSAGQPHKTDGARAPLQPLEHSVREKDADASSENRKFTNRPTAAGTATRPQERRAFNELQKAMKNSAVFGLSSSNDHHAFGGRRATSFSPPAPHLPEAPVADHLDAEPNQIARAGELHHEQGPRMGGRSQSRGCGDHSAAQRQAKRRRGPPRKAPRHRVEVSRGREQRKTRVAVRNARRCSVEGMGAKTR